MKKLGFGLDLFILEAHMMWLAMAGLKKKYDFPCAENENHGEFTTLGI